MANPDEEKVRSAEESARVLVQAVKNNLKPRDIITRKSIENAVAVIMATGGSTNAVLHFLAIAHSANVEWTIDDYERMRKKVPVICNMKPSGKYLATDLHDAGGIPQVMKILLNAGLLNGDCMTITGKTMAEELAHVPDQPRADQDVIMPIEKAIYAQGQDDGGRTGPRSGSAARRSGRHHADRKGDLCAGSPGDLEGQSLHRGLCSQDYRFEEPGHYRAGASI